jgi:iron complex outermembrane receptor protein
MSLSKVMRGVSAGALVIIYCHGAQAQQNLPTIEVGGARTRAGKPQGGSQGGGRSGTADTQAQAQPGDGATTTAPVQIGGPKDPKAYFVPVTSTATKTATPIMQTPVSVQVVPRQVLTDQQTVVIEQATRNVSNVFQAPYQGVQGGWLIRGFLDYAYYQDGVRVNPWAIVEPRDTVDVQQIEILKGPSSVMYGRMQPGGMVEVTTKMPQEEAHYETQQLFSSYSGFRTTQNATGPVTADKSILYRFDLAYQTENSFIDALHNRHLYFAPKILFKPTEDTSLLTYLNFYTGRDGLYAGLPANFAPGVPKALGSVVNVPISRNYGASDAALDTRSDLRIGYRLTHAFNKDWKVVQRLDLNFRDFPEGYVWNNNVDPYSCTLFSCPVTGGIAQFNNKEQNYFASVDLTGNFDTFGVGHTLLIGADGYRSNNFAPYYDNYSLMPAKQLFYPPYPGNWLPYTRLPDDIGAYRNTESWYGAYLQDQMTLPFNFHLLAGFRFDSARVIASATNYSLYGYSNDPASVSAENAIKPRVGLLWQPIPQLSLYGNYIEGFGVTNGVGVNGQALPAQQAQQWEGGAKVALFDDRLTATASYFDIIKTNVPSPVGGAGGGIALTQTTGAVRSTGFEFDIQGQVTDEIKIIGSYANTYARIVSDLKGDAVTGNLWWGVPRNSGSLWAVYEPQFAPVKGFALGAGFVARGGVEVDNQNSFRLPGYTTMDLMSRYSFDYDKRKITFQLNVANLLDQVYYISSGYNQAFGSGGFIPGTPRMFKGAVKVEF